MFTTHATYVIALTSPLLRIIKADARGLREGERGALVYDGNRIDEGHRATTTPPRHLKTSTPILAYDGSRTDEPPHTTEVALRGYQA